MRTTEKDIRLLAELVYPLAVEVVTTRESALTTPTELKLVENIGTIGTCKPQACAGICSHDRQKYADAYSDALHSESPMHSRRPYEKKLE